MTESLHDVGAALRKALQRLDHYELGWFGVSETDVKQALQEAHQAIGNTLGAPIAGGAPRSAVPEGASETESWARHDSQVRALACMEIHALGEDPRRRERIASVRRDLGSDGEAMTFPQHAVIGHGCTPALCVSNGWTLRDDGELRRWPREDAPLAPIGAYERSSDGTTWEPVGMAELRRAMASRWVDVTQAIAMLDEGREIPSVAAWYRRRQASAWSDAGAGERPGGLYPNRCGAHMLETTATARCGYCGRAPNDPLGARIQGSAAQSDEEREHAALAAASGPWVRQTYPSLDASPVRAGGDLRRPARSWPLAGGTANHAGETIGNVELAAIVERALRAIRFHATGWTDAEDRQALLEARDAIDRVLRETQRVTGGAPRPRDDGEDSAAGEPERNPFFALYPDQDDVEGWNQYQRDWEDEHAHGDCDGDLQRCLRQCPACTEMESACTPCKENRIDPLLA